MVSWQGPDRATCRSQRELEKHAQAVESVYSDPASAGTAYSWTGSHYLYNWSTKGFTTGFFWRIGVRFDDGQTYYVSIGLR